MANIITDKASRHPIRQGYGEYSIVLLIVLAGFAARIGFLEIIPTVNTINDQAVYETQAKKIDTSGLGSWTYNTRAPGYIVFVAALFELNGSQSKNMVRIEQSLLDTVSIAFLFGITRLVFASLRKRERTRIALVAAALWAFYPNALFFTQTYYTETLFVLLEMAGFYFLLRAYRAPQQMRWLVWSGLVWGLAALTREVALAFVLVGAPLWLLLVSQRNRFARAGVLVGVCLLVILPWTVRNLIQTHTVTLISTQGLDDIWLYNSIVLTPGLTIKKARTQIRQLHKKQVSMLQAEGTWIQKASARPLVWVVAKARQAAEVWSDPTSNWKVYGPRLKLFTAKAFAPIELGLRGWHLFLFAAMVVGLVWSPEPEVTLLAALFLGASLALFFLTHNMPRFRVSLQPILMPFSAFGIYFILSRRGIQSLFQSKTRLVLTTGLLALFAISLVVP